jgi:hypothetical protein
LRSGPFRPDIRASGKLAPTGTSEMAPATAWDGVPEAAFVAEPGDAGHANMQQLLNRMPSIARIKARLNFWCGIRANLNHARVAAFGALWIPVVNACMQQTSQPALCGAPEVCGFFELQRPAAGFQQRIV